MKYNCKYSDPFEREPNFRGIQDELYCEMCESSTNHNTRDFPQNLKNVKKKQCTISDEASHSMQECQLNG
jgi:hypothetical protein